jgi:signal transduction histidine kinase/DNA-binding response OmpR family regulator
MSESEIVTDAPGAAVAEEFPFLAGGGEMGRLIRAMDWERTPLGPVASWPQSLRSAVSILLPSKAQICLAWGEDLTVIYNDAYRPVFGAKHPHALGRPIREAWDELWRAGLRELFEGVIATGEAFWARDRPFFMERHGYLEETYFDVSYDPVRDESGRVGGLFCIVSETTGRVIGARRLRTLRELARVSQDAREVREVWQEAARVLAESREDIPFALLYEVDASGGAHLCADVGLDAPGIPRGWPSPDGAEWSFARKPRVLSRPELFAHGEIVAGPWPEPVHEGVVIPIDGPGELPAGYLVCGASPRLRLDDDYLDFLKLVAASVGAALAAARKSEDERRRAEQLAEIDRAKTRFFSNVSHEFRTPLTLLLGPLEDALAEGGLAEAQRERIELAHRNGLRLQKLVNALLDYSRMEAGRSRAAFRPTDLAAFTAELASTFRSAVEKAGLSLRVDCPPLAAPAYVDRDMWEKIVLNLLSNALKFTFEGGIAVALRESDGCVELEVRDTGVGMPAAELPRIFERFHRVEGARSRTHEGSGIGLSLVQEIVRLHGGSIDVESEEGAGTCFRVRIPAGFAHLPADHVATGEIVDDLRPRHAQAYVTEAARWDVPAHAQAAASTPAPGARPVVLLADDNADMREYVARMLRSRYDVIAVGDGEAALEAARKGGIDLVLTDVMMPRLDGIGLARELRAESATRDLPIVMLSARAGEEARIEGHEAGADDYLQKPFSARELLARVAARLELSALRKQLDRQSEDLSTLFAETPVAVAVLRGPDLVFDFANPPYLESIGNRDIVGLPLLEALPEIAGQGFDRLLEEVMRTGKPYVGRETTVKLKRGSVLEDRYFTYIYAPLRALDGRVERVIAIASDVTEQVWARERVERLAAEAQAEVAQRARMEQALVESDRRKDEFLATLAHELRNPLAPLRNAVQLARADALDEETRERIRQVMERQIAHLVRLVDDLMEVSRISRGVLELRRERVDLGSVLRNALETSQPLVQAGRHELEVTSDGSRLRVDGDPVRLAQVLSNLINNAAKYTPEGGRIHVRIEAEGEFARVTVTDSGVGIDPREIAHLFQMFRRGDPSSRRDQSGLGIGLALAQRLARMHGGDIEAYSEGPGHGSRFVVRLPLCADEREETGRAAQALPRLDALRILVVDDNADAAETLALYLRHAGAEVAVRGDGEGAVAAFAALRPAVVLLDIGMPEMDGYEVARRIREMPAGREAVIVALTGWGQDSDRRRAALAGFDHHLTKPADLHALQALLGPIAAAPREVPAE